MNNKMKDKEMILIKSHPPSLIKRIYSVWYRHYRVYTKNFISNGLPPFLEPLIFLAAIGLGLGGYITNKIYGVDYIIFLASGILVPSAMTTAAYECSFGTFIRLEFDKVYDGMLSSSITYKDLLVGELFFAGTKGLFFSGCVLIIVLAFGLVSLPGALLAPLGGFLTGLMFGALSLLITYFVKNINHFSFYFTGLLTPMFFFSGIFFPLDNIPVKIRWVAYILPLTHSVNIVRAFCLNRFSISLLYDFIYCIGFIIVFGFISIRLMKKRLIY